MCFDSLPGDPSKVVNRGLRFWWSKTVCYFSYEINRNAVSLLSSPFTRDRKIFRNCFRNEFRTACVSPINLTFASRGAFWSVTVVSLPEGTPTWNLVSSEFLFHKEAYLHSFSKQVWLSCISTLPLLRAKLWTFCLRTLSSLRSFELKPASIVVFHKEIIVSSYFYPCGPSCELLCDLCHFRRIGQRSGSFLCFFFTLKLLIILRIATFPSQLPLLRA